MDGGNDDTIIVLEPNQRLHSTHNVGEVCLSERQGGTHSVHEGTKVFQGRGLGIQGGRADADVTVTGDCELPIVGIVAIQLVLPTGCDDGHIRLQICVREEACERDVRQGGKRFLSHDSADAKPGSGEHFPDSVLGSIRLLQTDHTLHNRVDEGVRIYTVEISRGFYKMLGN